MSEAHCAIYVAEFIEFARPGGDARFEPCPTLNVVVHIARLRTLSTERRAETNKFLAQTNECRADGDHT
jgi:hypothetical protein